MTTQTFGTSTLTDTASNYTITGTYMPDQSDSYVCGTDLAMTAASTSTTIANHLKIVITAVDSTHVAGTFSGDFYYSEDITGAIKTITSGSFDVPWKK